MTKIGILAFGWTETWVNPTYDRGTCALHHGFLLPIATWYYLWYYK